MADTFMVWGWLAVGAGAVYLARQLLAMLRGDVVSAWRCWLFATGLSGLAMVLAAGAAGHGG